MISLNQSGAEPNLVSCTEDRRITHLACQTQRTHFSGFGYDRALEEAFAGLVTAPVFKTGEVSETMPGGFDSHPLPLLKVIQI